jgi:hypothetical protein
LPTAAFSNDSELHHGVTVWIVVAASIDITLISPLLAQVRGENSRIPPSCLLVDLSGFGGGICDDLSKLFLKLCFSFLRRSEMFLCG